MDTKTLTVLFFDTGLFTPILESLPRSFGRVLYHNPKWNASEFLPSNILYIGAGIPGIEPVRDFWRVVNEEQVDLFIFPDINHSDVQLELMRRGKNVWGSRKADSLEINRWEFNNLLEDIGLPKVPGDRIIGIDALQAYLKDPDNAPRVIKVSETRGDMETWRHESYETSLEFLNEIRVLFGPLALDMEFIAFHLIPTNIEVGGDHQLVAGRILDPTVVGYEMKDVGYIGAVTPLARLPRPLKEINAAMQPVLEGFNYCGDYSTEVRVGKDGKFYFIDPCCRNGNPPSQVLAEMFSNWGEIRYYGAQGIPVAPKPVANYGVLAKIYCEDADKHWVCYEFPEEIRQWVKFEYQVRVNGRTYTSPQNMGLIHSGCVVAVDDDPLQAVIKLKGYCDEIKGKGLDIKLSCIPQAFSEILEAEKMGYKFGAAKIPSVEEVEKALK